MDSNAISIQRLSYAHPTGLSPALDDLNLVLPVGSRTILVGANGAGKSTLLQILAGRKMLPPGAKVLILGRDVFRDSPKGVTFLGTEWAMNPVVRSDIKVSVFLDSVGGYRHKERRDTLLDILDVDLDWHMHAISDGERRRVQLVMGLMSPWDVLLLDEVTVDLDLLVRTSLLSFLRSESLSRGATILYATHIFDGLSAMDFPTHLVHMRDGAICKVQPAAEGSGEELYTIALRWLKEDWEVRGKEEREGRRKRRGRREVDVPSDSESFYKKYDYSH